MTELRTIAVRPWLLRGSRETSGTMKVNENEKEKLILNVS